MRALGELASQFSSGGMVTSCAVVGAFTIIASRVAEPGSTPSLQRCCRNSRMDTASSNSGKAKKREEERNPEVTDVF